MYTVSLKDADTPSFPTLPIFPGVYSFSVALSHFPPVVAIFPVVLASICDIFTPSHLLSPLLATTATFWHFTVRCICAPCPPD